MYGRMLEFVRNADGFVTICGSFSMTRNVCLSVRNGLSFGIGVISGLFPICLIASYQKTWHQRSAQTPKIVY